MKSRILVSGLLCLVASMSATPIWGEVEGVQWPSFRGPNACGISEGSSATATWSLDEAKNIKWKKEVPGLAHSSPVIWNDKLFVTTATKDGGEPVLRVGAYGDVAPVENDPVHQWKVYCIDKNTGNVVWERTACSGVPKVKRHPKGTHANSTPVTDGIHVVAFFGSEGLYCYDMSGELQWKKDFGVIDSGFFTMPSAQWGFGSSPIIHEGAVIVQCDALNGSFLAALDVNTGKELWRTTRDEVPTWSTPSVYAVNGTSRIVVNGFKHIGGYDFATGKEVWKLTGGGDIPVPTPVIGDGLIFLCSAHGKMSPVYAIKTDASGDISLEGENMSNSSVVWSIRRGGSYLQTPILYGDYLYNCAGNGKLTCFRAMTGEVVYEAKLGEAGVSFSASAVAADGKLYFPSEEAGVFVVQAGPEFKLLATNTMNDICMATPAISQGTLYFRTHHYLMAIAEK